MTTQPRLLIAPLLAVALFGAGGCTNATTPEGHEGYIYHLPMFFGQADYVTSQTGPTSTGLVWRQYAYNVDMRPKNYSEEFHILSRDNLNVGFQAHARISLADGSVRAVVEEFGGDEDGVVGREGEVIPSWYTRNVQQPYRAAVRDIVHQYDAYDIQAQTPEIGRRILERLRESYADGPVVFESMSIGNLTYPPAINEEIQRKLAAEQDLERMERERQIAQQEAEIAVTRARGRANAQRIVNETLTPLYVQHEMLEGFTRLSRSERVTIIAAPSGDEGASPVMLNLR